MSAVFSPLSPFHAVQDEWCHSQWASLCTSINLRERIPQQACPEASFSEILDLKVIICLRVPLSYTKLAVLPFTEEDRVTLSPTLTRHKTSVL